ERATNAMFENLPSPPDIGRRHAFDVRLNKLLVNSLRLFQLQDKQADSRDRDDRSPEKDHALAHSPTLRAPWGGLFHSLERRQMPQGGHLDPLPTFTLKLIAGLSRRHGKPAATSTGKEEAGHYDLGF